MSQRCLNVHLQFYFIFDKDNVVTERSSKCQMFQRAINNVTMFLSSQQCQSWLYFSPLVVKENSNFPEALWLWIGFCIRIKQVCHHSTGNQLPVDKFFQFFADESLCTLCLCFDILTQMMTSYCLSVLLSPFDLITA